MADDTIYGPGNGGGLSPMVEVLDPTINVNSQYAIVICHDCPYTQDGEAQLPVNEAARRHVKNLDHAMTMTVVRHQGASIDTTHINHNPNRWPVNVSPGLEPPRHRGLRDL